MVIKPTVSAFQNCAPRYMRQDIVRDIALAMKLVILWTGISVYTSIPVKKIKTSVRQGLTNGVQSTFSITKEARENSLDKTSA